MPRHKRQSDLDVPCDVYQTVISYNVLTDAEAILLKEHRKQLARFLSSCRTSRPRYANDVISDTKAFDRLASAFPIAWDELREAFCELEASRHMVTVNEEAIRQTIAAMIEAGCPESSYRNAVLA